MPSRYKDKYEPSDEQIEKDREQMRKHMEKYKPTKCKPGNAAWSVFIFNNKPHKHSNAGAQ